jgi:hypothetical protein
MGLRSDVGDQTNAIARAGRSEDPLVAETRAPASAGPTVTLHGQVPLQFARLNELNNLLGSYS